MFSGLTGENLDVFLSTTDFAVSAVWTATTVTGILDRETYEGSGPDGSIMLRRPSFLMKESSVPAAGKPGDTITIGGIAFKVETIEPDGTGLVTLRLKN